MTKTIQNKIAKQIAECRCFKRILSTVRDFVRDFFLGVTKNIQKKIAKKIAECRCFKRILSTVRDFVRDFFWA